MTVWQSTTNSSSSYCSSSRTSSSSIDYPTTKTTTRTNNTTRSRNISTASLCDCIHPLIHDFRDCWTYLNDKDDNDNNMGWRKKMKDAKKRHRPSLKDWSIDGLHVGFAQFRDSLPKSPTRLCFGEATTTHQQQQHHNQQQQLPVVLNAQTLTVERFWNDYGTDRIPCILQNIPLGYDNASCTSPWKAVQKWNFDQWELSPLRERLFKCGEDDDGRSIKVKLKYFLRYTQQNTDDSPLYVFDNQFETDKIGSALLQDYRVPSYFQDDLFALVSERRRPPYRWILGTCAFLRERKKEKFHLSSLTLCSHYSLVVLTNFSVGPERSGSCIHIDPLCTNAWNTLLQGQKRWVLFPPHVPKHIVKGKGLIGENEDDEAIHYFQYILPRIKQKAQHCRHSNSDYHNFACYEFTQHPNETVFVPHGWWHAVLNLTHTIGVTQNVASPAHFTSLWRKTRKSRPKMAWKLLQNLQSQRPALYQQAVQLNDRDNFCMKYDPSNAPPKKRKLCV